MTAKAYDTEYILWKYINEETSGTYFVSWIYKFDQIWDVCTPKELEWLVIWTLEQNK